MLDGVQDSRAFKDCTSRSFLSFLRPGSRSRLLLDLSSCKHPRLSEQLSHSPLPTLGHIASYMSCCQCVMFSSHNTTFFHAGQRRGAARSMNCLDEGTRRYLVLVVRGSLVCVLPAVVALGALAVLGLFSLPVAAAALVLPGLPLRPASSSICRCPLQRMQSSLCQPPPCCWAAGYAEAPASRACFTQHPVSYAITAPSSRWVHLEEQSSKAWQGAGEGGGFLYLRRRGVPVAVPVHRAAAARALGAVLVAAAQAGGPLFRLWA